ncbi:UDP-N-acetylglucosamine--N-acetylmuramyl-(pentapeptide) pyrophosphoryl-undecaprenol N-acetylglucosamine transferase [Polaromonas sp.]|nr:UDP-N-acetylglucosamine--N-acetylmuramyl-(pentapeptide) pyrophosphoryl-undecaprenol N-acetylglucosamine transferase [Candidatus Saccharibacteria bacterium]
MRIIMTGGGSGGHITPILAVAQAVKRLDSTTEVLYIGQTGDGLADIPAQDTNIDAVYSVRAGKFRRYHGEGWRQFLDIPTMFLNLRDGLYVLIGCVQSYRLLRRLRPDIIFVKGGFVGVPVGLAAASLKIPYVTHDSDAIPGLANRIIGRWARRHAVALPAELYPYPGAKTSTVGIPLVGDFVPVTNALQKSYRSEIQIPSAAKVLFVIGGGLGAQRINQAISEIASHLLAEFPGLYLIHGVGRANEAAVNTVYDDHLSGTARQRVQVRGYISDLYRYSGAADVVITRAGATNLAEFSVQGKACIVVPSPFLTGGHQLKNAQFLADAGAAVVVDEAAVQADANYLARAISDLLKNPVRAAELGQKLQTTAHRDAARKMAQLLLDEAAVK